MGATKKICKFILETENCAKSYFRNFSNYPKCLNHEIIGGHYLTETFIRNTFFVAPNKWVKSCIFFVFYFHALKLTLSLDINFLNLMLSREHHHTKLPSLVME